MSTAALRYLFLPCLLLSMLDAFEQSAITPYPAILQIPYRPAYTPGEDLPEGNPWLFDNWKPGIVLLNNNTGYDSVNVNFVPSANRFYFRRHDTTFELAPTAVEVRIKDSLHSTDRNCDRIFRNDVGIGKTVRTGTFIEILTEGKIPLFRKYDKNLEGRTTNNGLVIPHSKFVLHSTIFSVIDGKMIKMRLTDRFLRELTSDRQYQVKKFIRAGRMDPKNEADFVKAISYYNYISSPGFSRKVTM
jgi:hypothetical protein